MIGWIKRLLRKPLMPVALLPNPPVSLSDRVWADSMCPVCETKNSLLAGPKGGASVNVMCSSCGTRLNLTPMLNRIEWTHGPQPEIWGGKKPSVFPEVDRIMEARDTLELDAG